MRVARWLAGLLCPLSLLVTESCGVRFHPGQETFVKQLSSYEIITPVRVNEFGEVFPHTHHFSRRKRSLEAPLEPTAFRTHYQLSAYGQVFQLNLSADAGFIAAQYTVVHAGAPQKQSSPDLRHCFYRGHVNAQETHMAVFSICGGLMGTFKAHDGEYFLEPLMKTDGGEYEDEHNKPHLIYRHEELKKYQKSHKPCEVSEKELKKSTLLHPTLSSLNKESNVLQKSLSLKYALNNLSVEDGGNPHSRKKRFLSYPRYVEVMVTADTKMVRYHGQNLQHYVLTLMSIPLDTLACLLTPFLNRAFYHNSRSHFTVTTGISRETKLCSNKVVSSHLAATAVVMTRSDLIFENFLKMKAMILSLKGTLNVHEGTSINYSNTHKREQEKPSFNPKKASAWTPCPDHSNRPGSEMTLPVTYYVQGAFKKLRVAAIYKDSSIGNLINIVIVKLIVIHNEQEGPAITFNAATTLRNFCLWQQAQNTLDDAHPSHHDTAVLITREDICRAREKCDTLGLAELGTMCDPLRSCSISEENGLSAAFTIAHELGHVFNVPHDDSFKCKEAGIKHQYHVMAPTLNYHTSPWTWSKCSQKYITEFLDTGYGECLLDKPSGRIYDLSSQLPGSMYDVNKQCELMFGLGSQVCPYLKQCKRLWCTSTEGVHKGCRTQHMPLADGTVCGVGMHCRHGVCVSREMETHPVDGEWGPWGPYSSCSRTCGGGIKSATRLCNRPEPRNGGKYCVGRRMKFRSCNTDNCPKGKKDFREQQCSEFDGKHFNINGLTSAVRWLPKYSGISMKDRCKLFCRVSGTTSYYQLKDRVADGTPCGAETNDLCVQGLCRQAGCDHVLNSKARRDKCGICGGDNSSCKTLAGTFNSARYGYNIVVNIPKGATNIDIRQYSYSGKPEDDNYLALSDIHGNFILNGNFVVSMSKREINIQGAIFEYSGSNNTIERINSTDRVEEELTLQVLCVGNLYNPDVRYSFNVPIEDRSDVFAWDPYGPWQDCSRMCQGIRRRRMTCIRKSDHVVVSDQRCELIPTVPDVFEECNTECELRWHNVGKSDCTSKCGPGYRSVEIHCMKYSVSKGLIAPVDDKYCADQQKPPTREPCHGDCMLTSWHYTEWSECSRSCERGVRTREAFCMNNLGRHLPERECRELPRVVTQSCNEFLCPSWSTSEWSECPVTCGKGMKHRQVWCQLNDEQLRDDFCNPNERPESVTACELHECASWQVGPWGSCSVTCGRGYQMRAVKCVTGTYRVILDDDRECNAATRPRDNQECELPSCPENTKLWTTALPLVPVGKVTQWRYGSWTPCSASCGKGDRARYVSCRDAHGGIADESFCAHLPRPAEISSCFSPCGEWQVGNWSPCTVTCGSGIVTRQVICVNHHQEINENYCDPEGRPSKEQECNMPPCPPVYHHIPKIHDHPSYFPEIGYRPIHHPQDNINQWNRPSVGGYQWRTGPWGACSSTCAGGFHRRVVVCQDEEGRSASYCDEATKPPESRHCDSGPCPRWNYGNWGECTQTCGDGIKTRLVICQLPTGQMLGDQNCEILDKPPNMAQCNVHSCPGDVSWHRGPWKSCSVSCGKGLKFRDVHCFNSFQAKIEEGNCRHLKKPRTYKICRAGRCPAWKASRWKECSVTCGVGVQQRDVYCQMKGLGQVSEAMCPHGTRPAGERHCWLPACVQYQWLADEWEDCSTTYRREKEIYRKVKCVGENHLQVDESFCDPATKPASTKNCGIAPSKYVVLTGELSQCSTSCGFGYQQRITYCVGIHSVQDLHVHGLQTVVYRECPVEPSPYIYKCNVKGCSQAATWRVGKWTKCSVSCGVGVKERTVECMTENGLSSDLCLPRLKPDARKICHEEECEILTTCKDIQIKKGIRNDGEYLLNVKGRMIKIYCSGMHLENPKEYLTLVKGEADNFSEVYGFRLQNPYECPFNGSRRQDCACQNDYLAAGFTVFSKIRFDVASMQIKTTDFLFAQTILGRPVPFATAGDCYSAARCPQGQFSINLAGTGLRLSSTVRWITQGNYATADIHKSHDALLYRGSLQIAYLQLELYGKPKEQLNKNCKHAQFKTTLYNEPGKKDGTKIYGRCGGFCGKCIPNTIIGLQLQIQ